MQVEEDIQVEEDWGSETDGGSETDDTYSSCGSMVFDCDEDFKRFDFSDDMDMDEFERYAGALEHVQVQEAEEYAFQHLDTGF